MTCQHENIQVVAVVSRIFNCTDPALLIQVLCADCRIPFTFNGRPSIAEDGSTLLAPIGPVIRHPLIEEQWTPDP